MAQKTISNFRHELVSVMHEVFIAFLANVLNASLARQERP